MALYKGFLRQPKEFVNKQRLISGILLGTAFSYILYAFFYYSREFYRIATGLCYDCFLLELNSSEVFYYNLFYGSISVIISLYFTITFSIENSIDIHDKKLKFKQRSILNDVRFFKWSFLTAFMRLVSLIGIWYFVIPMQFDLDLLKEFSILFVLTPVVLFLNIWPVVFRTVGRRAYKWVLYSFSYVVILSFGFANINFIDYREIDQKLKNNNIEYVYSLEYPMTDSFETIYFFFILDTYVVLDSSNQNQPTILYLGFDNQIKPFDFNKKGALWDRSFINLHIDKRIPLSFINNIKQELRRAGIRTVHYSTGLKHSKYPPYYLKYSGIQQQIGPPYYSLLESFLDSAENLDYTGRTLRLPPSPMYRFYKQPGHRYIRISINQENTFLNGKEIADEKLRIFLYEFIKKCSPNYGIIFDPEENIDFGRYIHYLDMIYSAIDKLRHQCSYQLYNEPFENNRWSNKYDIIASTYPRNIIEWSPEEKRLIELAKRVGYTR